MKKENNEEKKSFLTRTSEFKTYEIILFSLLLIVVTAVLTLAVDNKILGHKTSSKKCASNSELEEVREIVRNIMENTFQLDVPLKVDIETGSNWYEAK